MRKLVFILLFTSCNVFAGRWLAPDASFDAIEVGGEKMGYPKGLYVYKAAGFDNPDNCPQAAFVQFTEEFLIDKVMSAALFAKTTQKKLRFYTNGCFGGYIQGTAFQLVD